MKIVFDAFAWEDYLYWQGHDREILKRINVLVRDIQREPNGGLGKPEWLRHDLAGYWSRRINHEHRLVYRVEGDSLMIASYRYHY